MYQVLTLHNFLSKIFASLFPFQVLRLASYLLAGTTTQIESNYNNSNRLFHYNPLLVFDCLLDCIFCYCSSRGNHSSRSIRYGSFDHISANTNYLNETRYLSDNIDDSVYSEVASSGDNLYVVWEQSLRDPNAKNYDIFFMVSNNGGINISDPVNLSNNKGFSEHPQISATENSVCILWIGDSNETRQILFRKSVAGGGKL